MKSKSKSQRHTVTITLSETEAKVLQEIRRQPVTNVVIPGSTAAAFALSYGLIAALQIRIETADSSEEADRVTAMQEELARTLSNGEKIMNRMGLVEDVPD